MRGNRLASSGPTGALLLRTPLRRSRWDGVGSQAPVPPYTAGDEAAGTCRWRRAGRAPSPPAKPAFSRHAELAAVIALLLLAAFLRMARLSMIQYRFDDDALYKIVTAMARTGRLPERGLTSTIALANGPFQAYLLAPLAWLGANLPMLTLGVIFLNILAVAIVYAFARDFFGRRAGLLALLLVAVNPWATVLSRRLLGNDMVAPFAALSLWMLARWLYRYDGKAAPIAAAALAVAGQVYVIGLECLAPVAMALLLAGRRVLSRAMLAAVVVFGVLVAPYVWTQVLPQRATLLYIENQPAGPAHWDFSAVAFALELAGNNGYQAYAAQAGAHVDATSGLPWALSLLARALYVLGLAIGAWTVLRGSGRLREERRGVHLLLLTAFIVPVALLLRPTAAAPVRILYLVTTFPLPYLYGALALDHLWAWAARLPPLPRLGGRAILASGVVTLVGVNLLLGVIFLQVISEYWSRSDYGIPGDSTKMPDAKRSHSSSSSEPTASSCSTTPTTSTRSSGRWRNAAIRSGTSMTVECWYCQALPRCTSPRTTSGRSSSCSATTAAISSTRSAGRAKGMSCATRCCPACPSRLCPPPRRRWAGRPAASSGSTASRPPAARSPARRPT